MLTDAEIDAAIERARQRDLTKATERGAASFRISPLGWLTPAVAARIVRANYINPLGWVTPLLLKRWRERLARHARTQLRSNRKRRGKPRSDRYQKKEPPHIAALEALREERLRIARERRAKLKVGATDKSEQGSVVADGKPGSPKDPQPRRGG